MSVALQEFDGKTTFVYQEVPTSAGFNAMQTGIQKEMEVRADIECVPGVLSGGACSINSTAIDVATITCYASTGTQLLRFYGSGSVNFDSGDAADTYYIYVDASAPTAPLVASSVAPTGGECILCSVAWNGTDTLSALADLREWGIIPVSYQFSVVGAVSADVVGLLILPDNFWVDGASASLETCGSAAGPTLIDIHGGTGGSEARILAADGDRASIAHDATDGAVVAFGSFDATGRKLTAGQKLLIEVDAAATDAADLAVTIYGRRY